MDYQVQILGVAEGGGVSPERFVAARVRGKKNRFAGWTYTPRPCASVDVDITDTVGESGGQVPKGKIVASASR